MIAFLRGVVRERTPERVVLEVHGVGYELHVPVPTYARLPPLGTEVGLHVHTHVREDAIQLFGFAAPGDKALFELLLRVNGVGPKLALGILALEAATLAQAIRGADHARLVAIPGIGRKIAERLVLELRDKLEGMESLPGAEPAPGGASGEVVSALVNLGYPRPVAEKAVAAAVGRAPGAGFDELFKRTMQALG